MKKLTKKLVVLTLGIAVVAGTLTICYAKTPISISINGRTIQSDAEPIMEGGRTLVPIRVISENLGAEVKFDTETKKVTITKDNTKIILRLNERQVMINNTTQLIDVPAKAVKGRTMVPIRFISESLNCKTVWDAQNSKVVITAEGVEIPATDVDKWSRAIRTANLPKGAEYFPYICEDVPNWAYESIVGYMKNTNGRAVWSGFGKDKFGTVYPTWNSSDKNTPKDFWNSKYSVDAYYNRVKKYLDFCVNIDYRKLTREEVSSVMYECFARDSFKDIEKSIDYWYNYYKNNKIVVSGNVTVIPEGFHMTEEGRPVVTALVTFKVSSQGQAPNDYGNISAERKQEGFKPPSFKTNVTYQGLFVNPMIWYLGDANSYQFDYGSTLYDMRDFKELNQ